MKIIVFLLSLSFSSVSFGLDGLEGRWCQFSPYNGEVIYRMEIDAEQNYSVYGPNEDGAVLNHYMSGIIDQGASGATMVSNSGTDYSPSEIVVTETSLTLRYGDRDITYSKCP